MLFPLREFTHSYGPYSYKCSSIHRLFPNHFFVLMMNISSSFKKSFRKTRKISIENLEDPLEEQRQPILFNHNPEIDDDHRHHLHRHLQQPIMSPSTVIEHHPEFIVKIEGGSDQINVNNTINIGIVREQNAVTNNTRIWREPSYELCKDNDNNPASELISQFLDKQKAAGVVNKPLDMDLEMDELGVGVQRHEHNNNLIRSSDSSPFNFPTTFDQNTESFSNSKELKLSYQTTPLDNRAVDIDADEISHCRRCESRKDSFSFSSSSDEDDSVSNDEQLSGPNRRGSNADFISGAIGDDGQVLKCSSFQRRPAMLYRLKTKSRLMDPSPERPERKSGKIEKSGILKSGLLGKASGMLGRASGMLGKPIEDEEDDPLFDEDLPEEYRKAKLSFLTLLQWISLILIVAALSCTLAISKLKTKSLRGLHWWKWEVLILVLICGRLVSGWGIRIVVFFIEMNFLLRKRLLYFVYGIRKAVQNCIWLGLVLIAWHYMLNKKVQGGNDFLKYVNKLMVCMLVATLLWLVKTLMVKVLASTFHVSTFFDRIQESLFNQFVIEALSGPPLIEIQSFQEEEMGMMAEVRNLQKAGATLPPELWPPGFESGKVTASGGLPPRPIRGSSCRISGSVSKDKIDPIITIDNLHRLNPKNISAWNMKRLMKVVRRGFLSTLDEQIMHSTQHDESATQIRSEYEAKVAARKIFRNVARPGAKYIYLDDLLRFLREEEALKTLDAVEGSSESEKISKAGLKNWVVNAFRERRALALTLDDTKTAVNKLHQIVNVLVAIIILIICLVILGIATSKFLLFASSQVVVAAFIFGNTCKTIFESVIFVFVLHPFDDGDRCEVDGVQMIVEEMNILNTVFLRYDNLKIMYPNSTLSTKPIFNYYRSPDMGDSVEFLVHIATPAEKIALMKQRILSYIENKKDHWYSTPAVVLMNIESLQAVRMSVWIRHKINHQDMGEKWNRRAQLAEEMVKIFKEVDLEYRLYPLDINIRTIPIPSSLNSSSSSRVPSMWTPGGP